MVYERNNPYWDPGDLPLILCELYMWIGYMDYPLFVGYFIIYTLSLDISIICVNYPHSISINDGEDVDNDD